MSSEHTAQTDVPPLTETIAPGTASDPEVRSAETATVTVDGQEVTLPAGSTLVEAVPAVEPDEPVPAPSVAPAWSRPTSTGWYRRAATRSRTE